ncbi:MAG: hypothetical protein HY020_10115 [Burkholderiales bacterium]|nr:hypothetical protein [Burkholderiales bacterium]
MLQAHDLATHAALEPATKALLKRSAEWLGWSACSSHRVLRVARSVVDLADADLIATAYVAEAIQLRRALHGIMAGRAATCATVRRG